MPKRKEPPMPEFAPPRRPYLKLCFHLLDTALIFTRIALKLMAICITFFVAFILALTWGK